MNLLSTGIVRLTVEDVIRLFCGILQGCAPPSLSIIVIASPPSYESLRLVIFSLGPNFRDVEEMLAVRGVALTYETVREGCLKFGQTYANSLRHKSPHPRDRWHLDEMFLKINGRLHCLWRAVDQDGDVLGA